MIGFSELDFAPTTLKLFLFFILLYHDCPQVQVVEKGIKSVISCLPITIIMKCTVTSVFFKKDVASVCKKSKYTSYFLK